jgi:hypothetical protein
MSDVAVLDTGTSLNVLADRMRDALRRRDGAREEWERAVIDLCSTIAEARGRFDANQEFHRWLEDNDLGEDKLNKDDRAAAIAMGRKMDDARAVLEHTERRSLQHIFTQEFQPRVLQVKNTTKPKKDPAAKTKRTAKTETVAAAPPPTQPEPEPEPKSRGTRQPGEEQRHASINIAPEVWDAFKAEAEAEGTSAAAKLGKLASADILAPPAPADLAPSAQQKFDAALRAHKKALEVQFEQKVQAEVQKRVEELVIPHFQQKERDAERVIKARKSVMPRATYRKILAALHPDDAMSKDSKREVFLAFKELELVIVGEAEMPTGNSSLPSTLEELMKRRKVKH